MGGTALGERNGSGEGNTAIGKMGQKNPPFSHF